jgi:hypothetical protein
VFENLVLRRTRVFSPKRDEMVSDWRKMHNEELHNLYSLPSIIGVIQVKENEKGRACSMYRGTRNACRISVGKPEGKKRPLGKPTGKWKDNIKIDLRKIGWGGMDWIHVDQDRDQWRALVNKVMNLRVP